MCIFYVLIIAKVIFNLSRFYLKCFKIGDSIQVELKNNREVFIVLGFLSYGVFIPIVLNFAVSTKDKYHVDKKERSSILCLGTV